MLREDLIRLRCSIHSGKERREPPAFPLPRSLEVGAPSHWGQVKQVVISEDHQCWIQRDEPRTDEDPHWFRVDLKTTRLSRVELPAGFRMLAATRSRLYGFMLTEFDAPVLRVFQLIDAEPR